METVKGLASNGVKVILTARNEKRGLQAIEKLKEFGFWDNNLVVFHQLDVTDPYSIASLVEFVKNQFGRLDILVGRIFPFCVIIINTEYSELWFLFLFLISYV